MFIKIQLEDLEGKFINEAYIMEHKFLPQIVFDGKRTYMKQPSTIGMPLYRETYYTNAMVMES